MSLTEDAAPKADGVYLRVLASGSAGNCSVLLFWRDGVRRICLVDLGLSPRRTVRLLAESGLGLHDVDDVLITHFDADHYYESWGRPARRGEARGEAVIPRHVRVRVHERHAAAASRAGLPAHLVVPFSCGTSGGGVFEIQHDLGGATVWPVLTAHDTLGSVAYRIEHRGADGAATLGFATDLGRVTDSLLEHFRGVDTMAIESNYCRTMQLASDRPEVLKHRIMGGAGHLSNDESAAAVREISPRTRAVLLHLSRQCNTPEAAQRAHGAGPCGVVVTSQHTPTPWLRIGASSAEGARLRPTVCIGSRGLFDGVASA